MLLLKMLNPGETIHQRYQLQSKLGRNAGRQTWLAKDLASDEESLVVVKLLAFGGDVQWADLKLFEREAQILQQLNHDRIPQYQDYFAIDDHNLWFGLVQQYIPGTSLRELLDGGKRFAIADVTKIAQEVLTILLYLHSCNPPLLHRDIKPSNLIMGEDNRIYLVDFGAVQDRAATEGATFTVVGTYGYAPMEQFGGKAVPASDLYALGSTIIHLLTRTPPADLPIANLRLQFQDRVTLDPNFAKWLGTMLHPAVEKRYGNAQQALNTLSSLEHPQKSDHSTSLAIQKRIRVLNDTEYLDLVVKRRGLKVANQDVGNVMTAVFFLIVCFGLFLLIPQPLGLAFLILFAITFSPYLNFLFGKNRIIASSQKLTLEKKLLFRTISSSIKTDQIQDISINYQAIKDRDIFDVSVNKWSDTILITTKNPKSRRGYRQLTFAQGLTEEEAIFLANKIRNWLQHN